MSMSEELSVANHDAEHPKPDRHDSVLTMHLAAIREMSEPRDGISPTPVSYIFFCFVLVMWGGWYIGTYAGDWTAVGMAERTSRRPPGPGRPPRPDGGGQGSLQPVYAMSSGNRVRRAGELSSAGWVGVCSG